MENWLVENPQEEKKLGVLVDHKFNMCQRSNVAAEQHDQLRGALLWWVCGEGMGALPAGGGVGVGQPQATELQRVRSGPL